jgi:hypothetical protein
MSEDHVVHYHEHFIHYVSKYGVRSVARPSLTAALKEFDRLIDDAGVIPLCITVGTTVVCEREARMADLARARAQPMRHAQNLRLVE